MKDEIEDKSSRKQRNWLRDITLVALAFGIGWWAHTGRTVHAQNSDVFFQFESINPNSALSLYYPDQKTIYVYQPAAVGYSTLNCAFLFKLDQPGGPVQREPCKAPSFQP
jgi:hypothetical protein